MLVRATSHDDNTLDVETYVLHVATSRSLINVGAEVTEKTVT